MAKTFHVSFVVSEGTIYFADICDFNVDCIFWYFSVLSHYFYFWVYLCKTIVELMDDRIIVQHWYLILKAFRELVWHNKEYSLKMKGKEQREVEEKFGSVKKQK